MHSRRLSSCCSMRSEALDSHVYRTGIRQRAGCAQGRGRRRQAHRRPSAAAAAGDPHQRPHGHDAAARHRVQPQAACRRGHVEARAAEHGAPEHVAGGGRRSATCHDSRPLRVTIPAGRLLHAWNERARSPVAGRYPRQQSGAFTGSPGLGTSQRPSRLAESPHTEIRSAAIDRDCRRRERDDPAIAALPTWQLQPHQPARYAAPSPLRRVRAKRPVHGADVVAHREVRGGLQHVSSHPERRAHLRAHAPGRLRSRLGR
jgi:hypothetical protein